MRLRRRRRLARGGIWACGGGNRGGLSTGIYLSGNAPKSIRRRCQPPPAERLARPGHHLDAAAEIAYPAEQCIDLGPARNPPRGIMPVFQPVGIANRRAALSSRPDAHLNLMFRRGRVPAVFPARLYRLMPPDQNPKRLIFVFESGCIPHPLCPCLRSLKPRARPGGLGEANRRIQDCICSLFVSSS